LRTRGIIKFLCSEILGRAFGKPDISILGLQMNFA
jgi:hypothetical protein